MRDQCGAHSSLGRLGEAEGGGSADIVGNPLCFQSQSSSDCTSALRLSPPRPPPDSFRWMGWKAKWGGGIFCSVHASNTNTHNPQHSENTSGEQSTRARTHTHTTGSHEPQQADTVKPVCSTSHQWAVRGGDIDAYCG